MPWQIAVRENFAHGTVFVDLAPVKDPTHVPLAIAYALGLREAGRKPLRDTLFEYLEDKHLLLVLDNLEHLLSAGPLIAELLSVSEQLKVLVTSRSVLHLYGEHDLPVSPLELPPATDAFDFDRLAQCGAIRLFVERAHAQRTAHGGVTDRRSARRSRRGRVRAVWSGRNRPGLADDTASARQHIEQSLKLSTEIGDRWMQAVGGLHWLGEIALRERDWPTARQFIQRALAIWRELGDQWGIAQELWALGYLGHAQGNYPASRASFEGALAIEHELDRKQGVAHNLLGLGWVTLEEGDAAAAERLLAEAIAVELEMGRVPRIAEGLEGLASAAASQRQAERALLLLGTADAAWGAIGHRVAFVERAVVDRWLLPARLALGDAAADAAWTGRSSDAAAGGGRPCSAARSASQGVAECGPARGAQ